MRDLRLLPAGRCAAEDAEMTKDGTSRRRGIQELTAAECMRLLATVPVGRVGITIDALPAVLPVNFVIHEDAVVFRTVPGTKLDAATAGTVVAFEADAYESPPDPGGWSVLVRGVARELVDSDELTVARALPLESWAWDGEGDRFVKIEPTLVTGRRVVG